MKILNKNGILRFDTSILVGPRVQKVGSFTPGWYVNPGPSTKNSGTGVAGSWSAVANAYDGNLGTDGSHLYLHDYGWISWDHGASMAFSNARIFQDYGGEDYASDVYIYGSNTGVFGGEETQVAHRTGLVNSGSWQEMSFTTYGAGPASFRYWKMAGYRNVGNYWWRVGEFGWYTDPGLVLCNVPFGCRVDLIASGVSQENQTSNSYQDNHLQFATASGIDTLAITENDGTTPWITIPFTYTSGDVWAFRWY